jgi:3D (Asp-Asp-Asp) domain-containing protein
VVGLYRVKAAMIVLLTAAITFDHALADASDEKKKVGRVMLTFYWIIDENASRYDGKRETELRDARGKVLARTHAKFRRDLVMEGAGWLRDGRTVMYTRKVGGEHRFRVTKSRYGVTATGCQLDPYRSVAVDPQFIKLGSKVYIPQLKGTTLPDGTIHDGIFTANDRGKFRGAHIDVFVGAGPGATRPFAAKGYRSRSHVTVYLEGSTVRRCDR